MTRKHLALGVAMLSALGLAVAAPAITQADTAALASTATTPDPTLLASSTPKTIVLDPNTGAVLSVSLGEPANIGTTSLDGAISPDISSGTDCAAGDGCYYTPTVDATYHDRSFYGSAGTFTGSWPRRNAWESGNYTAYVCWTSNCSNWFGPNSYVTFNGSLVTGTSFTIQ